MLLTRRPTTLGLLPLVLIDNEGVTDPTLNLALEEWTLRNLDPQYRYLLFYVNEPSIIIGRNQNTLEEINRAYVEARNVRVVRRMSGGGAVYHDEGNLNFSFMTDYKPGRLHNFNRFTRPLRRVLASMGVEAQLEGRNDLVAGDGRKISGNAQFSTPRRMFSHGTLMFNTNRKALQGPGPRPGRNAGQDRLEGTPVRAQARGQHLRGRRPRIRCPHLPAPPRRRPLSPGRDAGLHPSQRRMGRRGGPR